LRALARFRPLQLFTLALLFGALGLICFRTKVSVLGADIWWHLKVGDWIVQHASFPHNGILSRTAAQLPWAAYSWGYEVLLSRAYAWLGLVGVGIYGTALTMMVAFAVFWMTRRLSGRFWRALLLTVVCCYAFLLLRIVPRPGFLSIAFFCVVLLVVLKANRTGQVQRLYWLPLLFLFWANLHIQFIYGMAVVGLLLAVSLAQQLAEQAGIAPKFVVPRSLPIANVAIVFAACVVATLIGPYSYHLYEVIFRYSQAKVPYSMVLELQPFRLQRHSNYVQLLLAGAAFFLVASQKKIDLFKVLLLILTSVVAFRTMRDAWFQCIAAVACISDVIFVDSDSEAPETTLQLAGVFAAVVLVLAVGAGSVDFNEWGLRRAMANVFPVDAVDYLRQNPHPAPVWNIFDWGGFLSWYMPQYPVAIDGRTDLYGDELTERFYKIEQGDAAYREDPYLNESGIVLLRTRDGLVPLLENDYRFRRVYQDKIATVFVRR
jgi:hypothetical protein